MNVVHSNSPCHRVRPLLDSYVSNELLVETTHEVLRHIRDCQQCRHALQELQDARQIVRRAVSNIDVPSGLRDRIRGSLDKPQPVVFPSARKASMMQWATVAAAITLVAFAGWMSRSVIQKNGQIATVLDVGWNDHLKCALAGHLPPRQPERQTMLGRLESYAGLLPLVEQRLAGYQTRQAHQCTIDGRRYLHIAMQKEGVLLSVSIVRKNPGEVLPAGLSSEQRQGVQVVGFDSGTHLAYVIANEPRDEVMSIARDLAPGVRNIMRTSTQAMLRRTIAGCDAGIFLVPPPALPHSRCMPPVYLISY